MVDRKKKAELDFLREYVGVCPICAHGLKHPSEARCPECGATLAVELSAPFRFTCWHSFVIGICISIGSFLDRIFLTIYGAIESNWNSLSTTMIVITLIPLVILFAGLWITISLKKLFLSSSKKKQIFWYAASFVLPVIASYGQLKGLLYVALNEL